MESEEVSHALHSRQVIYTGGHFSTRIGYLSTQTRFGRSVRRPVALERAAAAEAHVLLLREELFCRARVIHIDVNRWRELESGAC